MNSPVASRLCDQQIGPITSEDCSPFPCRATLIAFSLVPLSLSLSVQVLEILRLPLPMPILDLNKKHFGISFESGGECAEGKCVTFIRKSFRPCKFILAPAQALKCVRINKRSGECAREREQLRISLQQTSESVVSLLYS